MIELLDEELSIKAQKGNEEAVNTLLIRYKNLVNKISRRYFLVGSDIEDIVQEGMIGLYKAIMNFSQDKNASFKTFASTCIKHHIQNAIKVASSEKNKVLSTALSITEDPTFEKDEKLGFKLFNELPSPVEKIIEKEKMQEIKDIVKEALSPLEQKILALYLGGYNYNEIAQIASISKKSIDNGLSRIKNKLSFLKEERIKKIN